MRFSQWAAVQLVPVMARIVLAAAFISLGWNKLFKDATFEGRDGQRLIELGVAPPAAPKTAGMGRDGSVRAVRVVLAAMQQEPEPESPSLDLPPSNQPSRPAGEPGTDAPAADSALPSPVPAAEAAPVTTRALHRLTLTLDAAGVQYARQVSWAITITELVGGVLLLVGLMSRIWALALAVIMAGAFKITCLDTVMSTWIVGMTPNEFNTAFRLLGLLALALTVVLAGPGGLSLDRLLFRRSPRYVVATPAPRSQPPAGPMRPLT